MKTKIKKFFFALNDYMLEKMKIKNIPRVEDRLRYKDVIKIESFGIDNWCQISTIDGKIHYLPQSIDATIEKFNKHKGLFFAKVKRNIAINLLLIDKKINGKLIFIDGEKFEISKHYRPIIREFLMKLYG